jgi:predicted enzyme related to lactoylglutathione lyase
MTPGRCPDPRNEERMTMLRGFATINYWAADLAAARKWYSDLLGIEPYFERGELDGRIIGPDDPDYSRARVGYIEFRVGDYQHELGLVDSRYAPGGPSMSTGGVVLFWEVDDVRAAVEKLLSMGAKEYMPITARGDSGFVTAAVVDPFGNILGVMYNPHYLEILRATDQVS